MTIAESERRCSMPLFYRRSRLRATTSGALVAVELVGADRVVLDAGFREHFLHGLDQSGRSRHVVDERREILQMALEPALERRNGVSRPCHARAPSEGSRAWHG